MTADPEPAPNEVPCPCGEGVAVPAPVVIRETKPANPEHNGKTTVTVNYRHEGSGCGLGGAVVLEASEVVTRVGPVFEPERFLKTPVGDHIETAIRHRDPETGDFASPSDPNAVPERVAVATDGGHLGTGGSA